MNLTCIKTPNINIHAATINTSASKKLINQLLLLLKPYNTRIIVLSWWILLLSYLILIPYFWRQTEGRAVFSSCCAFNCSSCASWCLSRCDKWDFSAVFLVATHQTGCSCTVFPACPVDMFNDKCSGCRGGWIRGPIRQPTHDNDNRIIHFINVLLSFLHYVFLHVCMYAHVGKK